MDGFLACGIWNLKDIPRRRFQLRGVSTAMNIGDNENVLGLKLVHDSIIVKEKLTHFFAIGFRDDSTHLGMSG